MKITKRELLLIIAAFFIIVGAVFFNYFYRPLQNKIKQLRTEIEYTDNQITLLQAKISNIERLEQHGQAEIEKFKVASKKFLQNWDDPALLEYLDQVLGKKIVRKSLLFNGSTSEGDYYTGDFILHINTDYDNYIKLINRLEEAELYNKIIACSLDGFQRDNRKENNMKSINISIQLRFYALSNEIGYAENKNIIH